MDLTALDKLALHQYSISEKEAVYKISYATMVSDGHKDPREIKLADDVADIIGLSYEEKQGALSKSEVFMEETITAMSEMKRFYIGRFMAEMIKVDGIIKESEELFIKRMFKLLNIPDF